jgi:hypothetical protein
MAGGGRQPAAAAVLAWSHVSPTQMILLSAIPGFVAVLCWRSPCGGRTCQATLPAAAPPLTFSMLAALRRYLAVLGLLRWRALETFILLLGHERGTHGRTVAAWAVLSLARQRPRRWRRPADRFHARRSSSRAGPHRDHFALFALFPGGRAVDHHRGYGLFAGFGEAPSAR